MKSFRLQFIDIDSSYSISTTEAPIKGYMVTNVIIEDELENQVSYHKTSNDNEYSFIMPALDVTIIPSYERVSNAVDVEDNPHTKAFQIEVNDTRAVVYEDVVRFTINPQEGYVLENIIIKDKNNNIISYRKTNKENEYEFTMPDTDILITPVYRKLENNSSTPTNPKTSNKLIWLIVIMGICSILGIKKITKETI